MNEWLSLTMMEEIEAAVDPEAVFADGDIFLRIDGPGPGRRDCAACFGVYTGHDG
jgi:hypothetical protein